MNKTLYLRDEDGPIWDRAREFAGDKLSAYIVRTLKDFVVEMEAKGKGFERIVLPFRDAEANGKPVIKAFYGRWIFPEDKPYRIFDDEDRTSGTEYAIAITAKNGVVVLNWDFDPEGRTWRRFFRVFLGFEEGIADPNVSSAVAAAYERVGVPVEELDI